MKKAFLIISVIWNCICAGQVSAQQAETTIKTTIALQHGTHRVGRRTDADMAKWRAYGLGQFIHWGLYSIPGDEWNGKQYNGASEWIKMWNAVPASAYDSLIYKFNPTKFDPDFWAVTAKKMGVKYVTITTKHHDGFCLWPSAYTNFTVANSPYKKDLIGPLVKAYEKQGIDVILYFSIMDWHNPDWRYDIKTREDSIAFDRFKQFTRHQLLELLTRYPSAKGLWFDGTWDKSWVKQAAFADSLEKEMKALHPGLIIGSRFRADEYGKRHFDSNGNMMGDYEQGWERKIPEKIEDVHGNDWDCVMTVPENQWGFARVWKGHIKTTDELLEMLAKCVSLDGNFVLNFGPKPDGTLRTEELDIAKGIGDWMNINNQAIYNGEYAGFTKQDWGYYIRQTGTNKIYMMVFNVPISGILKVETPAHMAINKVFDLAAPTNTYTPEEIGKSVYFIHLKQQTFKQPFVIVLETGDNGKGNEGQYQKAKI